MKRTYIEMIRKIFVIRVLLPERAAGQGIVSYWLLGEVLWEQTGSTLPG